MASHGLKERLATGLALAYASQAAAMLMGFVVTKVIVQNIAPAKYGIWLAAMQIAGYANLLDFGVLALLPRNIATLKETKDAAERRALLDDCVGAATKALFLQMLVLLTLGALATLLLRFTPWAPSVEMIAFAAAIVVMRPTRLIYGILDGLQEFSKLGSIAIGTQILGGAATVLFVWFGWGIQAVIGGWLVGQLFSLFSMIWVLHKSDGGMIPAIVGAPLLGEWSMPGHAGWMLTLQQLAQVLLSGSEILFITWVLEPAAVPAYVCTTKAGSILSNLPATIMNLFLPTLASLRQLRSDEELIGIIKALAFIMLTIGGIVTLGTVGINQEFVRLWVGDKFYLGDRLTLLAGLGIFLRQGSLVVATAAFAWGEEIASARAAIIEAFAFVVLALVGLATIGIEALPLAGIATVAFVSMPQNGYAVGRRVQGVFSSILGMVFRCACTLAVAGLLLYLGRTFVIEGNNFPQAAALTAATLVIYGGISVLMLKQEKLARYIPNQVSKWLYKFRLQGLVAE